MFLTTSYSFYCNSYPLKMMQSLDKSLQCTLCGYKTNHKGNFIRHHKQHAGETPYQCTQCDFKAVYKSNLLRHQSTHLKDKSLFSHESDCKTNIRNPYKQLMPSEEKHFYCNLCSYKTTHKGNFIRHHKQHAGETPYHCNDCDFKAVYKSNLIRHQLTHLKEKPFLCNDCDYKSNVKRNLFFHKMMHTYGKPFFCNLCEYKTHRRSSLIRHEMKHSKEKILSCDQCDYKTIEHSTLLRHLNKHRRDKIFSCMSLFDKESEKVSIIPKEGSHLPEMNSLNIIPKDTDHMLSCDQCDYKTVEQSSFIIHQNRHRRDKIFSCINLFDKQHDKSSMLSKDAEMNNLSMITKDNSHVPERSNLNNSERV